MSNFSQVKTSVLLFLVVASVTASVWMLAVSERTAGLVSALAGGAGYLLLLLEWRRGEMQRAAALQHREAHRELIESLQMTRSEAEAYTLLVRHLERIVPSATVSASMRGSKALPARDESQSCLATRLGRMHEQPTGRSPLLSCDICGDPGRASLCLPFIVGGEVIGSVLVQRTDGGDLEGEARERVVVSVAQAAPVLGNLRNLALAEVRAATDALTGLPNSRALRDSLKRMLAQASRTATPLAAILIDLDHFRRINDTHGHERGDDALAAVGEVLASTIRASDYAGRYGGEEFLVLLPDTDREGAMLVAEKLRQAIARMSLPGLDQPLSASLGVAALPGDGSDADAFLRLADRALYAAKAAGRNRVEAAGLSVATPVHD
jgi:diguanylate cyclase (GGDEF)-like protein